jgi:hypothetical protein
MTNPISRIQTLKSEAAANGDTEMVAKCKRAAGKMLIDSDTGDALYCDDIGLSTTEYVEAIIESLDCDQFEGHVRVNGRRVYAG